MHPLAILIHVPDVESGVSWYQKAFPDAVTEYLGDSKVATLVLDGFTIEIVPSDAKVGSGKFGTVLYWSTGSFVESLAHFEKLGAKLYRGPLQIEAGMSMCQLEDPFGNLIGLRGKDT